VFLTARLRQGAVPGAFLFPAEIAGDAADGTSTIVFDDPEIYMPGTSGAPVVSESGQLVGMIVRFTAEAGLTVGFALPSNALEALLSAHVSSPPVTAVPRNRGFLNRLLGR
jgi:hypothetical protein